MNTEKLVERALELRGFGLNGKKARRYRMAACTAADEIYEAVARLDSEEALDTLRQVERALSNKDIIFAEMVLSRVLSRLQGRNETNDVVVELLNDRECEDVFVMDEPNFAPLIPGRLYDEGATAATPGYRPASCNGMPN